ncbi:uncharacterized protein LOC110891353 [Helianthus annuus]|uniref:uncharacterized protein LOC110891353 n=1 Tax=Helianthus annuus TaxID=4232 RepID=UPI000B8F62D2|nr:uncharacterized protein LOC110891353 [Helianthus annuus]
MAKVLEGGPWLIRKVPLFLNVWSPAVSLRKEGIKSIPVWVKMYNVPIAIYTDDGLSMLASKIGTPKRLDGYTADMCADNWGRSSFARALIEINAENELKDHIIVAIPKLEEEGYITEKVKVEYEWKPQRCSLCCIFGHNDQTCAKNVQNKAKHVVVDEEGFTTDNRKVARVSMMQKRQKQKFIYKPKMNKSGPSASGTKEGNVNDLENQKVKTRNSFDVLSKGDGDTEVGNKSQVNEVRAGEKKGNGTSSRVEEEVVETIPTEMSEFMRHDQSSWNIRGLNRPLKQSEVRALVAENILNVCAILESHVDITKLDKVCKGVFRSWSWTSNGALCNRGTRIILGWNMDVVDVMILSQTDQVIHAQVFPKADNKSFFVSFVYAENKYQDRRSLWENLCMHKGLCHNKPWVLMGDFNTALHVEDSLYGPSTHSIGMKEFNECIQYTELVDINGHV